MICLRIHTRSSIANQLGGAQREEKTLKSHQVHAAFVSGASRSRWLLYLVFLLSAVLRQAHIALHKAKLQRKSAAQSKDDKQESKVEEQVSDKYKFGWSDKHKEGREERAWTSLCQGMLSFSPV